jgi:hypothetical protein
MIKFKYNDGGRAKAGYKGHTGDCVIRSISIATGLPYKRVYNDIKNIMGKGKSPRDGVTKKIFKPYLESLGWTWIPKMTIGSGCNTHLRSDELPKGIIICSVSKHMCTVIDGVLHDTFDGSRNGKRCVYGYFMKTGKSKPMKIAKPKRNNLKTVYNRLLKANNIKLEEYDECWKELIFPVGKSYDGCYSYFVDNMTDDNAKELVEELKTIIDNMDEWTIKDWEEHGYGDPNRKDDVEMFKDEYRKLWGKDPII